MEAVPCPFPTLAKLASECGEDWPHYERCVAATVQTERMLTEVIKEASSGSSRILEQDTSLALCGSFARYEMVRGSDCDWTLLVDGQANPDHAKSARRIAAAIKKAADSGRELKSPGFSGVFGNLSFSHELVHRIGGGADSNENLTKRVQPIHRR